jgi:hypothetical protein
MSKACSALPLTNAGRLWMELDLDQKQRLQQVPFPEGVRFDGERFGNPEWTSLLLFAVGGDPLFGLRDGNYKAIYNPIAPRSTI